MLKHLKVILGVILAGRAVAGVSVNTTETFDKSATGGALWGVGGADGWQTAYVNHDLTAALPSRFYFGNDVQRNFGTATAQPYPGSHSGAVGTLLTQHDCLWGNSNDPSTSQPYALADDMISYITFNSIAGVNYSLRAWVNTIQNVVEPPVPPGRDGIHPIVVNSAYAGFPSISIALKNGTFNPATDFDVSWTNVTGLVDKTWTQTPTVSLLGTGGPITIILEAANPDTKSGANIITDTSWDDVLLTPEPTSLLLLVAGGLGMARRR